MQEMQVVAADGVVVGDGLDAFAALRKVMPVQEHRAHARHQPIGNPLRAGRVVIFRFGLDGAEHRHRGAHHVHRVRGLRHVLEHRLQLLRQRAQALQALLVRGELGARRELLVHQQIGNLFELSLVGEIEDVVAAVVQVVAAAPDGAKRGVAGGHA